MLSLEGYRELSTGVCQALLEYNLFIPEKIAKIIPIVRRSFVHIGRTIRPIEWANSPLAIAGKPTTITQPKLPVRVTSPSTNPLRF